MSNPIENCGAEAKCRREFVTYSRTYYARSAPLGADVVDEICLSDGSSIELVIQWNAKVAREPGKPSPQLLVFADGWRAFAAWPDLFAALGQNSNLHDPSVVEIEALLRNLGFRDATLTEDPNHGK